MTLGQSTFRILDGNAQLSPPASALEAWYVEVRDIKIAEFDVADLARACRQNLYLKDIIPFCFMKLEEDPLAGELYDGELVQVLKRGHSEYWRLHPVEKKQFLALARRAYSERGDADLNVTEDDLLRK